MSLEFAWYLPTEEEPAAHRQPRGGFDGPIRWINTARAAELAGFHMLLVPSGAQRPDAWLTAAMLAQHVRRIRLLVGLRPGFVLPAVAAQRVATLQQITGPRLSLSVLTGGDPLEHRIYGDPVIHDDRFARASEYLHVVRRVLKERAISGGFHHEGHHFRVEGGGLYRPIQDVPPIYVGGSTPAAERVAAEHAHMAFDWAAPAPLVAQRIARLRRLASEHRRHLRVGCRVHLIAAQSHAAAVRSSQQSPGGLDALQPVAANLWTGTSPAGAHAAGGLQRRRTVLIGSYAEIAERLEELHALGVDSFILSSDETADDPLRIAEEVLPWAQARARTASTSPPAAVPAGRKSAPAETLTEGR